MILFAYGHQSLQVIHYAILWIVLSRMSIQPALRTQGQTDGMTKSSAWGTCAPLRGRLWRQGHGLSGFPSGISPAKSACGEESGEVSRQVTICTSGFHADRAILSANQYGACISYL